MILGFDHIVLTVRDPEATVAWYESTLGMRREEVVAADGSSRLALRFGDQKINLHSAGSEFAPHATRPTPGSADLCFLVESLGEVVARLDSAGVIVDAGPVRRTGATAPILSVYVRDPDGNLIELSEPFTDVEARKDLRHNDETPVDAQPL